MGRNGWNGLGSVHVQVELFLVDFSLMGSGTVC